MRFEDFFLLRKTENFLQDDYNFTAIADPHCPRCYKPYQKEICEDCKAWEESGILVDHQALYHYDDEMKDFFRRYKFLGDYQLAKVVARRLPSFPKGYQLFPIPLSPHSYQERGFNQVTAFLKGQAVVELLEKSETPKQSSLSRTDRLASPNPFRLKSDIKLPDKLLLVDDVYTTGRTLQHAVQTLKKAGVPCIKTFSIAR
ncbi:ComF family protein [Lactococcus termiticola]|uniref:Competence protein ComFC n=1 Tax=Lactococcus termiticola TaxID=2169526 RepID=A0A2R5HEE8_9LACT|nr:ComF family protein [Lactococcus termiticola]GBG96399.1 competence protein ComFC [Lactococcus termiticola]